MPSTAQLKIGAREFVHKPFAKLQDSVAAVGLVIYSFLVLPQGPEK
jgi:hypothetical protein